MMTVCNINLINSCKSFLNLTDIYSFSNYPYTMANSIRWCKIIFRILFLYLCNNCRNLVIVTISQKNRSCLRITDIYVTNTILFFFRTCIFMFFNYIIFIIINWRTGCDTRLRPTIHGQFVDIIAWFIVTNEITFFYHIPQCVMRSLIYFWCISIHGIVKLCLCTVNFQEWFRFPQYFFFCFFSIIYIVW